MSLLLTLVFAQSLHQQLVTLILPAQGRVAASCSLPRRYA